jgi:hypothetical protein
MSTEFKIEKNVPMPVSTTGRRESRYPFAAMEVGDSFFEPRPEGFDEKRHASRMVSACGSWGRPRGVCFTVRNVEGGVRVWRVEPRAKKSKGAVTLPSPSPAPVSTPIASVFAAPPLRPAVKPQASILKRGG